MSSACAQLLLIFRELASTVCRPQGVLPGGRPVAGLEMGRGLGGQVALVGLRACGPGPMSRSGQAGMRGQALIEIADLLAQVLLLQLQQRLGVLLLDAA